MRTTLVQLLMAALFAALAGCAPSPAPATPSPAVKAPTLKPELVLSPIPIELPPPTPVELHTPASPAGRFANCVITEQASPGNLRLVWIQTGDLWVWDRGEAEPYSLTATADVAAVRLAPDAETVAYTRQTASGPELWAVDILGTHLRQLAGGPELYGTIEFQSFSPDGQLLAFSHRLPGQGGELWVAGLDGTGVRLLVSHADLEALVDGTWADVAAPANVTWTPNTHTLTYDAGPGFEEQGIWPYTQRQVRLVDADTGTQEVLFGPGEGGQVQYSPDGATMAVITPESLRFMDLETGSVQTADVQFFAAGAGEGYAYPSMVWTPDSQALLLAQPIDDSEVTDADLPVVIWRVPRDGSPAIELAEFTGFVPSFEFSPDQAKIAYWRPVPPQSNTRELHITTLDGSTHIVYDTGVELDFLGWAPDSQEFVYSSAGFPGDTRLANLCGDPVSLGLDYRPARLNWSDPNHIILERGRQAAFELYLVVAGSPELVLNPESFGGYDFALVAPEG